MVLLTLLMSIGAVGAHVGTWLRQLYDGQPLVQGQLSAQHRHALACTHFTPSRCIHHWVLLGAPHRWRRIQRLAIVCDYKSIIIILNIKLLSEKEDGAINNHKIYSYMFSFVMV